MIRVPFKCPGCGEEFDIYADYAVNGIEGTINKEDGTTVRIVDPTEPHHCVACRAKALAQFLEEAKRLVEKSKEKKENDIHEKDQNPEN